MQKLQFILTALLFFSISTGIYAQGDLYITPNRVVFDGKTQKIILSIANTGTKTATYSVSFVQRMMNEDGSFTIIDTPIEGAPFADPFLRIYPRKVTLEPREGQNIVLQLKRQANMAEGEYRSHLYFRSEENYTPLGTESKSTEKTVSVQITPVYGISIPIIIRSGNVSSTVSLKELSLHKIEDKNSLAFDFVRAGNSSVYGDFKVEYIAPKKDPIEVGAMNGVAVYTNLKLRKMKIKLNLPPNIDLQKGKLKVSFLERDSKKEIATAELNL